MLGKMLKYDCKELSKTLVPFYIVTLVISIFNTIFIQFDWLYAIAGSSIIIVGLFVALYVVTTVLIISQFYKSVLGDQGYLTHTLPVSVDTIIFSKLLSSIIWMLLSMFVTILSLGILFLSYAPSNEISGFFSELTQVISSGFYFMFDSFNIKNVIALIAIIILFIFLLVLVIANGVLHFYCAISCSQIQPFCRNKIIGSFVAYSLISIPLSLFSGLSVSGFSFLIEHFHLVEKMSIPSFIFFFLFILLIIILLLNLFFYLPARYILKNKLNLE